MTIQIRDLKTFGELFAQKHVTFKQIRWLGEIELSIVDLHRMSLGDLLAIISEDKLIAVI